MEYIALTGISDKTIRELRDHILRTLEIRSPHNFFTSLKLDVGDLVYLTTTCAQDITNGTVGVIGRVISHQVVTHRIINGTDTFYEERETMMVRIQLQPLRTARIRKVLSNSIGEVTRVDAEEISFYNAR
ncbi:MAG: DUF473 domain-containing protein [Euryarchaeota archaeon]|nr:DUF473 domain-containing protein [Euryarchaeota archaeon]